MSHALIEQAAANLGINVEIARRTLSVGQRAMLAARLHSEATRIAKGERAVPPKEKGGTPASDRPSKNETKMNVHNQIGMVQSYVALVDQHQARVMRNTMQFERQRAMSEANIQRLAKEMATSQFTQGTQIFLCVLPDGTHKIINGNHTLEAIVASGVPQLLTITKAHVADLDEAGRIYAVFDIQKIRTWQDSLKATGQGDGVALAKYVLAAVGVIERKFGGVQWAMSSRLDRIKFMDQYKGAAEILAGALSGAPKEVVVLLRRAAVMAVALETIRYQPSLALDFWGRIAHDNGLVVGTPEKALLTWLRNARTGSGSLSQIEHAKASALSWNAFFRGEAREFLRPNSMSGFFLLGTPWSKGVR